jgi:hypothetical protein
MMGHQQVGGESFAVNASLIKADANRQNDIGNRDQRGRDHEREFENPRRPHHAGLIGCVMFLR